MQKQKYTIYACLIISFATYSFSLKEANQLVIDYQESMAIVSDYMVRKAQASEPQEASHEVLEEKVIKYSDDELRLIAGESLEEINGETVEEKIKQYFPENHKQMTALFKCESGLEANKAGDLSLTFEHNGEVLGSSHGIAQVRIGGNENGVVWNRAKANGMTAKEFIEKLEDPDYNLRYAKKIFDSRGYSAWYNCSKKIGLIK